MRLTFADSFVAAAALALAAQGLAWPSEPASSAASAPFAQRVQAAVSTLDRTEYYKSADSSTLGWGESYVLSAYYWMYEATADRAWLDRIVARAQVLFANLSPGDELHPGWRTSRYSVALVAAQADAANLSRAAMEPDPARIYDIETAHQVTGHTYEIRALEGTRLQITDTTAREPVAILELPPDGRVTQVPGVALILAGQPQPGDRFVIQTQAPKPLEYVVHDGMVLTPIAQFCAVVLADPALASRYGAAARRYLRIMETQLIPKWEPYWRDLPDRGGVYLAQDDPAQRFPGASLPHNQYLALGCTIIALYRATGKPFYRERAERMARFFKRSLRLVGGHYEWNYWDYAGPWDEGDAQHMAHTEDTSHGHIDIAFALDAYDAGIVFDRQDLQRFARTVTEAMWNGDAENPRVGGSVASSADPGIQALDWVRLGRFSTQVRSIMTRMLESAGDLGGSHIASAAQALAMEREGWPPAPRYAARVKGPANP